jgi:isochorismate hydrolase
MKEKYFSTDTIIEKSKNMLADIYVERQKHKFDFSAEHSGLLVLDMQEYFLRAGSHAFIPSADAIVSNIEM